MRAGVTPYCVGVTPQEKGFSAWCMGRRMSAEELLIRVWQMLCVDGSPARIREAFGMVDALYTVGQLEGVDAFNWKFKMLNQCPGHCHERWCAYCGDIPQDEDTPEEWNATNWKELHGYRLEAGKSLNL